MHIFFKTTLLATTVFASQTTFAFQWDYLCKTAEESNFQYHVYMTPDSRVLAEAVYGSKDKHVPDLFIIDCKQNFFCERVDEYSGLVHTYYQTFHAPTPEDPRATLKTWWKTFGSERAGYVFNCQQI